MNTDHFSYINTARKAEQSSKHPTHKVGATIVGKDSNGDEYIISKPNFWPQALENTLGRDTKLGNASTTVHAEVAAILSAPATQGATLYVTDLPCPNCSKVMAESAIEKIYIDANTHNTPLGKKMKRYFDLASKPILQSAGISVYEVNDNLNTIKTIISPQNISISQNNPTILQISAKKEDINHENFIEMIRNNKKTAPFSACFAKNKQGLHKFILAEPQTSIGLSIYKANSISTAQNKYEPVLQPINRLLLTCARYGLHIDKGFLYSSQVPTAREFVNMIGAGYTSLHIGDHMVCRDKGGLNALEKLTLNNIIDTHT